MYFTTEVVTRIMTLWVRWAKKGCTRLADASDKVYQLFAHGRWFSPGTPASPTTKTGRHDIAEKIAELALDNNPSFYLSHNITTWKHNF
jgi:hypothetical protein